MRNVQRLIAFVSDSIMIIYAYIAIFLIMFMKLINKNKIYPSWSLLSEIARKSIYDAKLIAEAYGHEEVTPEHILLSIINQDQGVSVEILNNLNIDIGLVKSKLEDYLRSLPSVRENREDMEMFMSKELVDTVLISSVFSKINRQNWIGTHDILLSILIQSDIQASKILRSCGLTLRSALNSTKNR